MATLKDLKPSISELPNEEALRLIDAIRRSRRTVPKRILRKRKKGVLQVEGMSSEDVLEILRELGVE